MKKIISAITAAALTASVFCACTAGSESSSETVPVSPTGASAAAEETTAHTLYYKDSAKSERAVATFFNSVSGESEDVEMEKIGEDSDSVTFACEGDTALYNMVFVSCDGQKPNRLVFNTFAFNKCVSGWYKTEDDLLPYTYGKKIDYTPELTEITLTCADYDKPVHIWTPDGYDASSDEKYSTIYVLDGEMGVFTGKYNQQLKGCQVITEQVRAMMSATGEKAIVVAVENIGRRDFELVPNIGEPFDGTDLEEEDIDGTIFADFVANTLVPYIRQNYNVYTDARHTSITGASLGGMEAFYITTEYPGIFGSAGCFSPSFWDHTDESWNGFLVEKTFGADSPVLYFYTGPDSSDVEQGVTEMYDRLTGMGYPGEKLLVHIDPDGLHDSTIWRNVFSEYLTAMVYGDIVPLK